MISLIHLKNKLLKILTFYFIKVKSWIYDPKSPNLANKIYSENGAIVVIQSVMQKPCGVVTVGEVVKGAISEGEFAAIQAGDKTPFYDEIKRIEVNHTEVSTAYNSQLIGILLKSTSKEGLLKYLEKNWSEKSASIFLKKHHCGDVFLLTI